MENFALPAVLSDGAELEITVGHWAFSDQFYHLANQNLIALLGPIYCTFPMGKPFIVYNYVPTFNEWLTNF